MGKYADYLKANGASDEDIKVMASPLAEKLFEKQQADLEAAATEAATIRNQYAEYQGKVTDWYNENNAALLKTKEYAVQQRAEAEKARAALIEANRQGLLNVTKDLGYDPEPPKQTPAAPDDRYLTLDTFTKATGEFAGNLTGMMDVATEHARLFPNDRPNFTQMLNEARAAGTTLIPYWERKYKVSEAREAAAQRQRDAEIAKWKQEGAKEKETELISKFGNPEMRPLVPSKSPFTVRKEDSLRSDNQPWNKSESQLSNDRVARASAKLMERQSGVN